MYPTNPFNPYPTVNPAYLSNMNNNMHLNNANQIIKVNGRNGAEAYQMPPNSQVLLLDETQPLLWLKQTDGAGYPTLNAYDIKPHEEKPVPDYNTLEERIAKIEEVLKNESYHTNNSRKVTTTKPSTTNDTDDKVLR